MYMLVKRHIGQRPGLENKLLLALIVPIIFEQAIGIFANTVVMALAFK